MSFSRDIGNIFCSYNYSMDFNKNLKPIPMIIKSNFMEYKNIGNGKLERSIYNIIKQEHISDASDFEWNDTHHVRS